MDEDRKKLVLEKHAEGWTDREIGELVGVTRQRVQQQRKRLGLARFERAKKFACKWCGVEVAKGSTSCVPCFHKNKPVVRSNTIIGKDDVVKVFEARVAGKSVKQIAQDFGVKPITIYVILSRRSWQEVEVPELLVAKAAATRSPRSR